MSAKKATKTANVFANIYEGHFDVNFDCVGVTVCRFALCFTMPPEDGDKCHYNDCGSCVSPHSKQASLGSLKNRISKELKLIEENFEG